jgi:hypothetical protein
MESLKKETNFVVKGLRCEISFEIDTKRNRPENVYMGLTATFDGGGGQSQDRIREVSEDFPEVIALLDLWDTHHMKKPTDAAIAAIIAAMDAVDGERYGVAGDVDDAPDVSETDDIIDSRDVIKRIEIYREALTTAGIDPDETTVENFDSESREDGDEIAGLLEEFHALKELEEQGEDGGDWQYGATLVRESYFQTYAESMAEDIGAVNSDAKWPNNHIDWEAAADELRQDYTEVTFKKVTYLMR